MKIETSKVMSWLSHARCAANESEGMNECRWMVWFLSEQFGVVSQMRVYFQKKKSVHISKMETKDTKKKKNHLKYPIIFL